MNVTARPATEAGGLDGFSATCSLCGMELTSTMESAVLLDVQGHVVWHQRQDAH